MIITVLGSCGNQTATREAVALLVDVSDGGVSLLIDTGPGVVASLCRSSRRAADIDFVFLTHTHADHIAGFPYFAWQRHYERLGMNPASDLTVFGGSDALSLAAEMVKGCYGNNPFPFHIKYQVIVHDVPVYIQKFKLLPIATDHTTPSFGIIMYERDKKVVYTSDTAFTESFANRVMNPAMLLHEGMWTEEYRILADRTKHSTAGDAGRCAKLMKAEQLVLLHIFPGCLGKEGDLLHEAGSEFSGPISIPTDGSVFFV